MLTSMEMRCWMVLSLPGLPLRQCRLEQGLVCVLHLYVRCKRSQPARTRWLLHVSLLFSLASPKIATRVLGCFQDARDKHATTSIPSDTGAWKMVVLSVYICSCLFLITSFLSSQDPLYLTLNLLSQCFGPNSLSASGWTYVRKGLQSTFSTFVITIRVWVFIVWVATHEHFLNESFAGFREIILER